MIVIGVAISAILAAEAVTISVLTYLHRVKNQTIDRGTALTKSLD